MKYIKTTLAPLLVLILLFAPFCMYAGTDTVYIDGTKVQTGFLREGTTRYLVYFSMEKDAPRSRPQFWTRTIAFTEHNGKSAVKVVQDVEDRDSVVHRATSICDKNTFATLYHHSWWKQNASVGEFDIAGKKAVLNEQPLSDDDTARSRKAIWQAFTTAAEKYTLNWHLDLEVFSILPYKEGVTFMIPYYDPGLAPPRNVPYTVTGSAKLTGYDQQPVDCWLLEHESRGMKEVFWISKKTQEVLKLEGQIGKDRWRYKIRLAFSV